MIYNCWDSALDPYLLKHLSGEELERYIELQTMATKKPEINEGVIYYNSGYGCLVRLAVSISTLRNVYSGPCTIISNFNSYNECKSIAKKFNVNVCQDNFPKHRKNSALLNKTRLAEITPYNPSIFIDADTIILKDFTDIFRIAKYYDFVATNFCDWTAKSGRIRRRIKQWANIMPDMVKKAYEYQYAINTGVFAFMVNSELMTKWYDYASKGETFYIPDETCCQAIINSFPHYIVDSSYNQSCKFEDVTSATKIIHYHGRKHCRLDEHGEFLYNAHFWWNAFEKIRDFVEPWIQHDKQLRKTINVLDSK